MSGVKAKAKGREEEEKMENGKWGKEISFEGAGTGVCTIPGLRENKAHKVIKGVKCCVGLHSWK